MYNGRYNYCNKAYTKYKIGKGKFTKEVEIGVYRT